MATYTSYLNLEKPTTSETFNLLKMNQNWDKIDAGVSALNSNVATKIPFYSYTIADNFPTATNIQNFFNIETGVTGIFAIGFIYNEVIRSTLYYSAVNNKYGAGILVSYYGDKFAKVVNANGTVTITSF